VLSAGITFSHPHCAKRIAYFFATLMIGYYADNLFPARAGDFARLTLMGRENGISRAAVLKTILAERVLDGLFLSVAGVIAAQHATLHKLCGLPTSPGGIGTIELAAA
jgi:hypothetical protein